jgi:hypothetical protein
LIPSVMIRNSFTQKASAADWEYVKVTDDDYPELSVGRLDAGTAVELGHIIDKIIAYENSVAPDNPKALLITDHEPTFDLYMFEGFMNQTLKSFETPWTTSYLKQTEKTKAQLTAGILDALNNQVTNLMLFNGHGSWTQWGKTNFWNTGHLASLQAGHYLPVVIEANCNSSDFFHPNFRSLGTQMLQKPNAGAIAVIGSTSMTPASSKSDAFISIVDNLLRRGYPRIGDALLRAKIDSSVENSNDQATDTMNILGLPSLRLKGASVTQTSP